MVLPARAPAAPVPINVRATTGLKNLLTVYPAWEPTLSALVRNLAAVVSVGAVVMSITNGLQMLGSAAVLVNLLIPVVILLAVVHIRQTGRFSGAFLTMTVLVFLIICPIAFFSTGGIDGAIPYYFFVAVTVTSLMFQGLRFYLAIGLEICVFVGCILFAVIHPEAVVELPEADLEATLPICMFTVIVQIALAVHSVYRFYLRAALDLESSNERLRQAAKNKDAFLAMIAHELKTPMAIMSTHAQEASRILGAQESLSPELSLARRDVEIMMAQAESLSAMVSQLLDLSRIADGRLVLSIRPIDLSEVVQSTLAQCAPICAQNGNELRLAPGGAHPRVLGDASRIERVLVNLIANATRHTQAGSITLSVTKQGPYAKITVEDTGEGMTPQAVTAALTGEGGATASYNRSAAPGPPDAAQGLSSPDAARPVQAVSLPVPVAAGSRHGGLGLGLRIVRHLVEAHGGAFTLESQPGQGTRASFTLPLAL
ncbi:MAG: hypothetical protein LBD70_09060 [Bifidobacteriaceae bacterium]|jgi:signal transduction histidine kinase|nr:hypothetical protein [Bifidobacteriaceae bacterium]